jgi:acetyltransferase-like isoleucine patch superfamily enzyme
MSKLCKKYPDWVKVEGPITVEDHVLLGHLPGRKINNISLLIGRDAIIRSGTVIYAGSKIGKNLETGHNVVIREENLIGNGCSIWSNSVIDYGCRIGNNVKIHCNCYVAQYTVIEDSVFLAPGVTIANDKYPGFPASKDKMVGPTLKRNVIVGVNVTILPAITIGEGSLIGAGSVVTKDIPDRMVACGNPARLVKRVDQIGDNRVIRGF